MFEQIVLVLVAVSITEAFQCVSKIIKSSGEAKVLKAQKEKADAERRKNESAELAAMHAEAVISAEQLSAQTKLDLAIRIEKMTPEQIEAYNKTLMVQEALNRPTVQYIRVPTLPADLYRRRNYAMEGMVK